MICNLCKTDTKICNSHIIPEFLYRALYDKGRRAFIIPVNVSRKIQVVQRGHTDRLLCRKCESQLSKYEKYTKLLLFGGGHPIKKKSASNEHFEVHSINYTYFKLFLLSILWRASITEHYFFNDVSLGKHEEYIRTMIFAEQPGAFYQYGCLMASVESQGELLEIIRTPNKTRLENHNSYTFLMGGFMWVFIVSDHSNLFSMRRYFLQEDGNQVVLKVKVSDLPFLIKEFQSLRQKEKDMTNLLRRYNNEK